MAVVPCKRFLLIVVIVICYFSSTTRAARSLGVPQVETRSHNQKADDDLNIHDAEQFTGTDDLVAMDYTPASKKPPIHN